MTGPDWLLLWVVDNGTDSHIEEIPTVAAAMHLCRCQQQNVLLAGCQIEREKEGERLNHNRTLSAQNSVGWKHEQSAATLLFCMTRCSDSDWNSFCPDRSTSCNITICTALDRCDRALYKSPVMCHVMNVTELSDYTPTVTIELTGSVPSSMHLNFHIASTNCLF